LNELERLLKAVGNEDVLLAQIEVFLKQIQTVEVQTADSQAVVDELNNWITQRWSIIEQYIFDGGVEGEPGELNCFAEGDLEGQGFNDLGEVVTTLGHSCSTIHPVLERWLFLVCLLLWS